MPQTLTEKIFSRSAGRTVHAGETVVTKPDFILAYDFPGWVDAFIRTQEELGIARLAEPDRYVVFIDHLTSRGTEEEESLHDVTRRWAAANGVTVHEGEGIGHQLAAELGYAAPGRLLVHFDAHISAVGALGALGFGLHRQLLDAWVTGEVELPVPATTRVELTGCFADGVDSRDLLHALIASVGAAGFLDHVLELTGPGARDMRLDLRQGFCGMIMFTGAVAAIFPPDDLIADYVRTRARGETPVLQSDDDAAVAATQSLDLGALVPHLALPGSTRPDHTVTVEEAAGQPIQRGYIGSCASGRADDLRAAAAILRDRTVASDFRLVVVPTTRRILDEVQADGTLDVLRRAGAVIGNPSCDFCYGYAEPLQAGESALSTGVLNVRGRLGSPQADIYMGSAATVAAAAVTGCITDPRELLV